MKNKRSRLITCFIYSACILLCGCDCNYDIDNSRIKSSCKFDIPFYLSKIIVDSLNRDRVPCKYKEDTIIICKQRGLIGEHETSSKVYFDRVNEDYEWVILQPAGHGKTYDMFPLTFKQETWYDVANIRYRAGRNPTTHIYFYIGKDNEWTIKIINWTSPI